MKQDKSDNDKNTEKVNSSFIDRSLKTLLELTTVWKNFSSKSLEKLDSNLSNNEDIEFLRKQITDSISKKGGEISNKTRVMNLGILYFRLSDEGKLNFHKILAKDFDVDKKKIEKKIEKYLSVNDNDESDKIKYELELQTSLIPKRIDLLKQFRQLDDGFQFLIDMRVDLLPFTRKDPFLKKLDNDFKYILKSGFDISLLDLKLINWDSSADMLEKLIKYEAVHEIESWRDLKSRLDSSDRKCYGFFHYKMPNIPLIFVEIAFTKKLSSSIQALLNENSNKYLAEETDTAIFYSISNTQKGLAGIPFGNFLIKRVVEELSSKHKNLKKFATFSPVPGFRKWLDKFITTAVNPDKKEEKIFSDKEIINIRKISGIENELVGFNKLLATPNWFEDEKISKVLKTPLMRLCVMYFNTAKRGKRALDPVTNFHITNGAYLKQINWLADTSKNGMKQSAGIMVNYNYKLSEIDKNHELYISEGKIKISKDVNIWLKKFD